MGGRDRTGLVDGVLKQAAVVQGVVGEGIPVHGVLCFIDADWPLLGGPFDTREVSVTWPKRLYRRLDEDGTLSVAEIDEIHRRLAAALAPS